MKKLLILLDVEDDAINKIILQSTINSNRYILRGRIYTPPTKEDIEKAFTTEFNERPDRLKKAFQIEGANWLLKRITDETH